MTTLLNGLWQGTVLTVAVFFLLKLLPRLNAATRYAIWWITLAVVAILPLRQLMIGSVSQHAESSVPPVSAVKPLSSRSIAAMEIHRPVFSALKTVGEARANLNDDAAVSPAVGLIKAWFPIRPAAGPVSDAIITIWALASTALLVRLAISYGSMQRLKRCAGPAPERLRARLNLLNKSFNVRRQSRLLISDAVASPMVLGLFDPAILIPRSLLQQMSAQNFDHVALHELAHLHRYDDWMNFLQKLLEAMLPIQPLLFWIGHQLTLERETACDDWVIAATGTPKPYAASLTHIAEVTLWARCGILASGAVGHPSQLFRRVQRLLDGRRNIVPRVSTRPLALVAAVVWVLAYVILSAPQMVALADSPPATTAAPAADADADDQAVAHATGPGSQIQSFTVQPGDKLVMDVDLGNVHVATWTRNSARIIVTQTTPNLAEFLKHHHITMTQKGHEIDVIAKGDGSSAASVSSADIEYQISVPEKFDVQLKDGVGNAEMTSLEGMLDASTGLGNIDLQDCSGELGARSGLGNIDLRGIAGPADFRTGLGNIEATGCSGVLRLTTGGGNIEMKKMGGSVDGRTGSGNIEAVDSTGILQAAAGKGNIVVKNFGGPSIMVRSGSGNVSAEVFNPLKADSSFTSGMGDVEMKLGRTIAVELSASTAMGRVHSEFPMGAINGGGPFLRVTTGSGDIHIHKQ